jgi:hypothetical protein
MGDDSRRYEAGAHKKGHVETRGLGSLGGTTERPETHPIESVDTSSPPSRKLKPFHAKDHKTHLQAMSASEVVTAADATGAMRLVASLLTILNVGCSFYEPRKRYAQPECSRCPNLKS